MRWARKCVLLTAARKGTRICRREGQPALSLGEVRSLVTAKACRTCRPRGRSSGRLREWTRALEPARQHQHVQQRRAPAPLPTARPKANCDGSLMPSSYEPVSTRTPHGLCNYLQETALGHALLPPATATPSVFKAIVIRTHCASRPSTPNCAELLQPPNLIKIACHSRTLRTLA